MSRRSLVTMLGGVCGVIVAHAVAYLWPLLGGTGPGTGGHHHAHGHDHAHLHADTGYWKHAAFLAAATALCAVVLAAHSGWVAAHRGPRTLTFRERLFVQTLWQSVLYGAMEVAERVSADLSPVSLLTDRAFLVGAILQVLVAVVVLAVLGGVEMAAARLAERYRRLSRPGTPQFTFPFRARPVRTMWVAAAAPRAPPLS